MQINTLRWISFNIFFSEQHAENSRLYLFFLAAQERKISPFFPWEIIRLLDIKLTSYLGQERETWIRYDSCRDFYNRFPSETYLSRLLILPTCFGTVLLRMIGFQSCHADENRLTNKMSRDQFICQDAFFFAPGERNFQEYPY